MTGVQTCALPIWLGLVGLFSYLTVNFTTSTEIRATDLISKPIITQLSSLETSITFTTSTPIRTELILTAPYLSNKRRVVVSSTPRTIHQLTIDGLVLNQQHSYQIVLIDNKGAERDRKSTRLNSSHIPLSRMPSSA